MENSLENLEPNEVKEFFRHLCIYVNDFKERDKARYELSKQIDRVRDAPKKWIFDKEMKELNHKIDSVVKVERDINRYRDDKKVIENLLEKNKHLQRNLAIIKKQRDNAVGHNRLEIEKIKDSIMIIKDRMGVYLEAKEERDNRLQELESKVVRVADSENIKVIRKRRVKLKGKVKRKRKN